MEIEGSKKRKSKEAVGPEEEPPKKLQKKKEKEKIPKQEKERKFPDLELESRENLLIWKCVWYLLQGSSRTQKEAKALANRYLQF